MSHQQPRDRRVAYLIDSICDDFEDAWTAGETPTIEDFLSQISADQRPALFRELLATELEFRRKSEACVPVDTYLVRFPHFTEVVNSVFSGTDGSSVEDSTAVRIEELFGRGRVGPKRSRNLRSAVPDEVLESHLVERTFAPGESLMRQGDPGKSLMVVCNGVVEIRTEDTSGKVHVIDHSTRGDLLGEMSLLTGQPCTASVVAAEPVRILEMSVDTFHDLARQYPEMSVIITNLVADRLGKPGRDALADKLLDRYRIRRRLGRGGMGVVYEADDTVNNERVALKMMSHRLVYNNEALQRFRQEADIIETFQHPHIVKLVRRFAAFHTYFIAMDFCEGRTLQQTIADEGPLSNDALQKVLGQMASAISYAHDANVVHRDIKPSNIMLDVDGGLKLTDFGLAEPAGSDTPAQRVCGTPRFMAPEQRIGRRVSKEADYFGLGCVAYEMITGEHLFGEDDMAELTRDFTSWQPPEFKQLRPGLSDDVCLAIQPSLEVDVRRRILDLQQMSMWA